MTQRLTRTRASVLLVAIAVATTAAFALAVARPALAAPGERGACGDACPLFDFGPLRDDVIAFVPTPPQRSFLVRIDDAARALNLNILPPNPILPPSPIAPAACAASTILGSLATEASRLASAGTVSPDGLSAITSDVAALRSQILAAFLPVDPCLPPSPI